MPTGCDLSVKRQRPVERPTELSLAADRRLRDLELVRLEGDLRILRGVQDCGSSSLRFDLRDVLRGELLLLVPQGVGRDADFELRRAGILRVPRDLPAPGIRLEMVRMEGGREDAARRDVDRDLALGGVDGPFADGGLRGVEARGRAENRENRGARRSGRPRRAS